MDDLEKYSNERFDIEKCNRCMNKTAACDCVATNPNNARFGTILLKKPYYYKNFKPKEPAQ
jgi:DTW domain-containing protein YfiP